MAEPHTPRPAPAEGVHDGRFAERFDGEIDLRGVFWVAVGIILTAVVGMLVTWWGWRAFVAPADAVATTPSLSLPAPPLQPTDVPLLQQHPEVELEGLRREMADELSSWQLDPATGTAKVPIEVAMEVLLARGVPSREPPVDAAPPATQVAAPTPSTAHGG